MNLTSLALACDRTGVSHRAAAIIASSVLKDVCIIETLKNVVKNGLSMCQIIDFPCHTQAVERCIKLVTEASNAVCGDNKRDGFIRATLLSRKQMPTFNTKKQFDI